MGFIFPYRVKVIKKRIINEKIIKLSIEKPYNYECKLGQVVDLSIDAPRFGFEVDTFTIVDEGGSTFFDIVVKRDSCDSPISDYLSIISNNESIFISHAWDAQKYKGSGLFIVENIFVAQILNLLKKFVSNTVGISNHRLLVINEDRDEVLFEKEMKKILGSNYKNVYCKNTFDYVALLKRRIDNFQQKVYVCGTYKFERKITSALLDIGFRKEQIYNGSK